RPRPIGRHTLDDQLSLVGAGLGSLGLVWLVYFQLLPFSGLVGFAVVWYLAFLALYASITVLSHPRPEVVDRVMAAVMYAAAIVVGSALVWTLLFIFGKGYKAIVHANFFTQDMAGVSPSDSLNHGGIKHVIVGSVIMLAIAVVISLPLGIGTAVFL